VLFRRRAGLRAVLRRVVFFRPVVLRAALFRRRVGFFRAAVLFRRVPLRAPVVRRAVERRRAGLRAAVFRREVFRRVVFLAAITCTSHLHPDQDHFVILSSPSEQSQLAIDRTSIERAHKSAFNM
jgi:hypothetical protein